MIHVGYMLASSITVTTHIAMSPNWTRLIRFIAEEDGQTHLGEVDSSHPDIGLAIFEGKTVSARAITGSVFDGIVSSRTLTVHRVRTNDPWTFLLQHG